MQSKQRHITSTLSSEKTQRNTENKLPFHPTKKKTNKISLSKFLKQNRPNQSKKFAFSPQLELKRIEMPVSNAKYEFVLKPMTAKLSHSTLKRDAIHIFIDGDVAHVDGFHFLSNPNTHTNINTHTQRRCVTPTSITNCHCILFTHFFHSCVCLRHVPACVCVCVCALRAKLIRKRGSRGTMGADSASRWRTQERRAERGVRWSEGPENDRRHNGDQVGGLTSDLLVAHQRPAFAFGFVASIVC